MIIKIGAIKRFIRYSQIFLIVLLLSLTSCREPELPIYQVGYDLNGGQGTPPPQSTKAENLPILVHDIPDDARLDGYDFIGWNISKDGSGSAYAPGTYYEINSDVTFFAQWNIREYSIVFFPNGGNDVPAPQKKSFDIDIEISTEEPTRAGFDFVGWNETSDGNGKSYSQGETYTDNADLNLYAQWLPHEYFEVFYDANGGSQAPESQLKDSEEPIKLTDGIPIRFGYSFIGWNTSRDGTRTMYSAGDYFSENSSTTLFAQWEVSLYFTIEYESNGGTGGPSPQTKPYDGSITLSLDQPELYDYTFTGWNTQLDGSGDDYVPGDTYSSNDDLTLYAQWEKIPGPIYQLVRTADSSQTQTYYYYPRNEYIDVNNYYYYSISEKSSSITKSEYQMSDGKTQYQKITTQFKPIGSSEPQIILTNYKTINNVFRAETYLGDSLISVAEYEYYKDAPSFIKRITHDVLSGKGYSIFFSKPVYTSEEYYVDSYSIDYTPDFKTRTYYTSDNRCRRFEQYINVDGTFKLNGEFNYYYLDEYVDIEMGPGSAIITYAGNYSTPFYYTVVGDEIVVRYAGFPDLEVVLSKSYLTDF